MAFVELPGVYLDAVTMDAASTALELINRNPGSGETGSLINENVALDIASLTGNAIDVAATDVYVDIGGAGEALVYDGGAFQAGWDGAESASSNPDANTLRIVIDQTAPFASFDVVTIRVVSQDVGATETMDESYSFTVQDLASPGVLTATPQDLDVLRIEFTEAVKQVSASDSDDALNPLNYAFVPLTLPAVIPVASSIISVSATEVDVTTDIEFSPGKNYRVTVDGIADLEGNVS